MIRLSSSTSVVRATPSRLASLLQGSLAGLSRVSTRGSVVAGVVSWERKYLTTAETAYPTSAYRRVARMSTKTSLLNQTRCQFSSTTNSRPTFEFVQEENQFITTTSGEQCE